MGDRTLRTLHSFLKENNSRVSSDVTVKSYSHDHGFGPVLCMVHGYPESAYMFVIRTLRERTLVADDVQQVASCTWDSQDVRLSLTITIGCPTAKGQDISLHTRTAWVWLLIAAPQVG